MAAITLAEEHGNQVGLSSKSYPLFYHFICIRLYIRLVWFTPDDNEGSTLCWSVYGKEQSLLTFQLSTALN